MKVHIFSRLFLGILLLQMSVLARADVPSVVVSIKPVHSIMAGIMQGIAEPALIVDGEATPYDAVLSSADIAALDSADIVIWVGKEMEAFLVEPLAQLDDKTAVLSLLDNQNLKILPTRIQNDARDPFFWIDTRNGLILVTEFANILIAYDPQNAERYRRNAAKLLEQIGALDRKFEYGYRSVKAGKAFLYHDTLQYFEQAYGTRVVGTLTDHPGMEAGVQAFLDARARIYNSDSGVNCVLTEAGLPGENTTILVAGTDINVVELDSLGTRLTPGPDLYSELVSANFEGIKRCFETTLESSTQRATSRQTQDKTFEENEILPSTIRGKYILQDQNGKTVSDADYQNTFQLVTFGYTSCPDICPTTLQIITGTMKQLGERGELVQPIFITVDPQRDNVERMNQYVGYFHPRLVGLSGAQGMIDRVAKQFKVRVEKVVLEGSDPDFYTVNHTAGTYLIAPGGQMLRKFAYATTSKEMVAGIEHFLDQL